MNALVCTVGAAAAAAPGDNKRRLRGLETLLDKARQAKVDLIVMPGGYFASSGKPEYAPMFDKIKVAIEERGIAICFGVDTQEKYPGDDDVAVQRGRLPWYAFAWTPTDGWKGPWRQRSKTSRDQRAMPVQLAGQRRIMYLRDNIRIGVLMCGELFNPAIEQAVRSHGVVAVADMVHSGAGFRFHDAGPRWCRVKPIRATLMSCHVQRPSAIKRWAVDGRYHSTRRADLVVQSPIRIESTKVSFPA